MYLFSVSRELETFEINHYTIGQVFQNSDKALLADMKYFMQVIRWKHIQARSRSHHCWCTATSSPNPPAHPIRTWRRHHRRIIGIYLWILDNMESRPWGLHTVYFGSANQKSGGIASPSLWIRSTCTWNKKKRFVVAHTWQVVRWGFSYEYGPNFLRKTESNQELAISMFIAAIQQGRATLIGAIQVFTRKGVDKLESWARLLE